ncbi:efflux transporter outer membrane subunit [Phenylobacterium immobile]|uniref:efflux transporter outer membrane subunit n=1 Tax=Phenylobacterium immobile TaxID=21 RepID=UPI000B86D632|nr:efflux transporter outer membrane subunit [Phenylobacterium immobile]
MPRLNRLRLASTAAVAGVLLAGCTTVGPDFNAPAGPTGAAADGFAMAGDPTPSGVRLDPAIRQAGPWWRTFASPALDRTIAVALQGSPNLAEAQATLERYQADARAVRGDRQPQVDADASGQRERINTRAFGFDFPNPTISLFSVGATVSYDLDLFGGARRREEQAQARLNAAGRQADAAYLSLTANVARQAMLIAGLRGQMAALEAVIEADMRTAEMVRRAKDAGGEAPAAVNSAQAQLAEDQALLPPIRREYEAARHQLALLVGRSPADWTAPDFDLDGFASPAEVPVALPSALVRTRPDILAAEADLHAATAAVGVATADLYPNLRLSANFTQSALKPSELFGYDASGWNVLAGATAPLFHGGALRARRQAAEADARISAARYQATVLRAFVQVADALAALATDADHIIALERVAQTAAADVHNADAAYRLGGGSLLQLVDAHRRESRAARALAEARARKLSDFVDLFAAAGADWRGAA